MIELYQLEQLTAFAQYGTLSKAAEELHISQPTLTRSMQKLESEFNVPLFRRSKNKLEFNENGLLAAEYARRVLDQSQNMLERVRAFDRASRTISIGSCAPMPLITAVQNAARQYPSMTISSECKDCEPLVEGLRTGLYQIIILPYQPDDESLVFKKCGTETLFFALPRPCKTQAFIKRRGGGVILSHFQKHLLCALFFCTAHGAFNKGARKPALSKSGQGVNALYVGGFRRALENNRAHGNSALLPHKSFKPPVRKRGAHHLFGPTLFKVLRAFEKVRVIRQKRAEFHFLFSSAWLFLT